MLDAAERLDLLVRVLSYNLDGQALSPLRAELLSDLKSFEAMLLTASRRQLMPAAIDNLVAKGIVLPSEMMHGTQVGFLAQVHKLNEGFQLRRNVLANSLKDIIAGLNGAGVEPLILKGSMSLISGEPAWRFQRDIDFTIDPDESPATVRALSDLGYSASKDSGARPHHLVPMLKEGLPASIEPHVKLAGARARKVLPDAALLKYCHRGNWNGAKYSYLSPGASALHGLAHHHFQNRGYVFGTFSLKGLMEFAHALSGMSNNEIIEMETVSHASVHLHAAMQVWCTLSSQVLNVTLPTTLSPSVAAIDYAARLKNHFMTGTTGSPLSEAAAHATLLRAISTKLTLTGAFCSPLSDALHSAVWLDRAEQRRNASGILADK